MQAAWTWTIDAAITKSIEAVERGLRAATLDAASLVQSAMRESAPTGRKYGKHTASAPGQPPAIDTGRLVGAVFGGVTERVADGVKGLVVANVVYAATLEIGNERIAPRPYIQTTIAANFDSRFMPIFAKVSQR